MIKYIIIFFVAMAGVNSQMRTMPYPRPCSRGIPTPPAIPPMPAIHATKPPCANPVPVSLPASLPTSLPASMPVPITAPPCASSLPISILNTPYEISLPAAFKAPILQGLFELPLSFPASLSKGITLPCELPLPTALQKPPCGCLDAVMSKIEMPIPRGNPFLPAASPVSALAPYNPLLPPANTCSRCQHLKKIPIPPPCI